MYIPPHFEESRLAVLQAFVRTNPFATLVAGANEGLEAEHLPLRLKDTLPYGILKGHLARANPLWRQVPDRSEVLVIFHGPHSYISPSWYPSKHEHGKVVPTWNYLAVHARGQIQWRQDPQWLQTFLEELTDAHEEGRNRPWRVSDAPAGFVERLIGQIVGFEIVVSDLRGKWKLSQNRAGPDRAGVIDGLQTEKSPAAAALSEYMRDVPNGS